MEIKWQTPSFYLHLLSFHQVFWQQHHFLGIRNLLRRFMPEWNFALEIHVQAYDMHSVRYLFSLLTYIWRRTSTWSVGCKNTSQHVQTCSPACAAWLQQHKLITAEREPIVLTKPTFIKVQQPHSKQTEMSSLSWIMPWQTHTFWYSVPSQQGWISWMLAHETLV